VSCEISETFFIFYELVELEDVAVIIVKDPRENWILTKIIKTTTTVLVDQ